jgi:hypothetical protein
MGMEAKREKKKDISAEAEIQEAPEPSAYSLVWQNILRELDSWAQYADYRDDVFIQSLCQYADGVKRNQENIELVAAQLMKEAAGWERAAREEFLMATTLLQHFYPVKSYEEINLLMDRIRNSAAAILREPCLRNTGRQTVDISLKMAKEYMEWRRKGRAQYIRQIRHATGCLYENQLRVSRLLAAQTRVLLTFNRFLEKEEKPIQ